MMNKHPLYALKNPLEESGHAVWVASTLTLLRNFSKFSFPTKLDLHKQEQVGALIYDGLKQSGVLQNPAFYQAKDLPPLAKEFLSEHFLALESFHQAHGGEGFVTDDSGRFLAVVNVGNHLQIHLTDTSQEIENAWGKLVKLEQSLGKTTDFAYNSRFGFLTADPAHSGTGLLIRLILHIPAVIHTGELPELLEREGEEEIIATGIQGSTSEMIGDLIVIGNGCTTGVTEEYLLTSLRMWATKAVLAEITTRKKLKATNDETIKNKVGRALGLLTHSYQLETIEALNALSLVRLGVELGWIESKKTPNFNHIFLNCRRAHLLNALNEPTEIPELPKKRAEYLQSIAKDISLVI